MRILALLFISLLTFSCKKSTEGVTRLLRTESTDNYGNILYTAFGYDNANGIVSIIQNKNNAVPAVAVTIHYIGNEVILLSHPDGDPSYNKTMEVHLLLDGSNRVLRRIEYTYGIAGISSLKPAETFRYDTLLCEYDAGGLLKSTRGSRYDSVYVDTSYNSATHFISAASYTNDGGNLQAAIENVVYPIVRRANGITSMSGGSSEYHTVFVYAKSYPNHADFKNAAVLNEYKLYYESPFNNNYKNMPDQVTTGTIDKDRNGVIIFSGGSTVDIDRTYNAEGLLSAANVPSHNTPYKLINYFYGR